MLRVESITGKRRVWKPSCSILNRSTKRPLLPMLNHWTGSQRLQQTGSLCAGPLLLRLGLFIVCSDQICRGFTASGPFVFHSFRAQSATKCVCLVSSDEVRWAHSIYLISMRGAASCFTLSLFQLKVGWAATVAANTVSLSLRRWQHSTSRFAHKRQKNNMELLAHELLNGKQANRLTISSLHDWELELQFSYNLQQCVKQELMDGRMDGWMD